jgi:hypothetical protein
MSKLTLSLENLEVSTFEPMEKEVKPAKALEGTYDTVGVFCTAPKYSCIYACFPQ